MMIDPPIEELKKIAGNEYILTNIVAKRAKELEKDMPEYIEHSDEKAISIAARELYAGKIVITDPKKAGKDNQVNNYIATEKVDDTKLDNK